MHIVSLNIYVCIQPGFEKQVAILKMPKLNIELLETTSLHTWQCFEYNLYIHQ